MRKEPSKDWRFNNGCHVPGTRWVVPKDNATTTLRSSLNGRGTKSCHGTHLQAKLCQPSRAISLSLTIIVQGLTQLALENNELSRESTFHALGSIPGLLEVNLNYNKLRCVPRVRPGGFPNLEVIGLAANKFEFFEDLYTLTEYPNLRRVVLWGNNIQVCRGLLVHTAVCSCDVVCCGMWCLWGRALAHVPL